MRRELSLLQNASKTEINEIEKVKVGKKQHSTKRSKQDSKKQSAENIEELVMTPLKFLGSRITNPSTQKVYEPTPKRLRIVSNVQNFDRNMESIIEACAKNVSTSDKSSKISLIILFYW